MPKETLALKLHIEVDAHTAGELDGQSRICNWLYNHLLEKSQQLKQEFKQSHNTSAAKTLYSKRGLRDRCQKKAKKLPVLDDKGDPTGKQYTLPSKRWKKYNNALQRAHYKRREQTKTFMYTSAHQLFQEYDCVAIGDYTPNGEGINTTMRRAMNNRSLIGRWKETLSWVAHKSGKTLVEFNEQGTTRTCSHCLHVEVHGIPVTLRQWQCPQCQAVHIRDENAAINGLRKVLRDLSQKNGGEYLPIVSCSDLAFVKKRWAWRVLPSGVLVTLRGQDSELNRSSRKLNRGHDSPRSKVDNLVMFNQV